MRRQLNYTGRKKVTRKEAIFSYSDETDATPEFNVLWSLEEKAYPDDAVVYVEAHFKETRQRFEFGTASNITPPTNRRLDQLDLTGTTLFDVLIVDESGRHGLLLGRGDGFSAGGADDEENRNSLLAVKPHAMGQQTWRVEIETGDAPVLYINKNIPDPVNRVRTDPVFQSLVLPAALREVLTWYAWNEDTPETDEHCAKWLAFAGYIHDDMPDASQSEIRNWIDDVVQQFCERFHMCDNLINKLVGDSE